MVKGSFEIVCLIALACGLGLGCSAPQPAPLEVETPADSPRTLTIVSMNDFHGALYEKANRYDPETAFGGAPWLAGAIATLRAEVPDMLLLDGGDTFQGSWPVNATRGLGAVEFFELLQVDATCVGNHEFDYGAGGPGSHPLRGALEEAAEAADYAWLSANVVQVNPDGTRVPWNPPGIEPWTILERAGVRVGLIGLTTTQTPQTTLAAHVFDLEFADPVETVRRTLPEVRAAGAEVIVVLGHLAGACRGSHSEIAEVCSLNSEMSRLLTELPRGSIDVLVAGHDHTLMAHRIDDTFILSSGAEGRALSRLDLVLGPDGIDFDATVLHDPWVLLHDRVDPGCGPVEYPMAALDVGGRLVEPSRPALDLVRRLEDEVGGLCVPVGCSDRMLLRNSSRESEVGNFVADAMLAAFPEADFAIQNSGGLRADLPDGELRREHLHAVMPFENRLLLVEMTGERLLLLLRLGASGVHGVFQVAGGSYHFDPERTGGTDLDMDGVVADWELDRLCSATVAGAPIVHDQLYKVVLTDFIYTGGDHSAPACHLAPVVDQGPLLRDVLYSFTEDLPDCLGESVAVVDDINPRIVVGACD